MVWTAQVDHQHHHQRQRLGAGEATITLTVQPADSLDMPVMKLAELGNPLVQVRSLRASQVPKTSMAGRLRVGDLLAAQSGGKPSRLEPQSRFGDKLLEIYVVCPRNGTAVLKGCSQCWESKTNARRQRRKLCPQSKTRERWVCASHMRCKHGPEVRCTQPHTEQQLTGTVSSE